MKTALLPRAVSPGLLVISGYKIGKCREFSVNSDVWQKGLDIQHCSLCQHDHSGYAWDLVTNTPTKRGRHGKHLHLTFPGLG